MPGCGTRFISWPDSCRLFILFLTISNAIVHELTASCHGVRSVWYGARLLLWSWQQDASSHSCFLISSVPKLCTMLSLTTWHRLLQITWSYEKQKPHGFQKITCKFLYWKLHLFYFLFVLLWHYLLNFSHRHLFNDAPLLVRRLSGLFIGSKLIFTAVRFARDTLIITSLTNLAWHWIIGNCAAQAQPLLISFQNLNS